MRQISILCLLTVLFLALTPVWLNGADKVPDSVSTESGVNAADQQENDSIRVSGSPILTVQTDNGQKHENDHVYWKNLPLIIKILIGSFVFFIGTVVVFLLLILSLRVRKTLLKKISSDVESAFREFVLKIILSESQGLDGNLFDASELEMMKEFENQYLKNNFNKTVVVSTLLHLHKSLSGETAEKLKAIYLFFGFDKDAKNKLNNKKWFIKAQAIKELEQMEVRTAYRSIYRCINHPDEILRSEAQMAIVSLKRNNHLSFLLGLEDELSEWQQINLLNRINNIKNLNTNDIPRLLSSLNGSVVRLGIKLIQYLNLVEYSGLLLELFKNSAEKIRIEAIRCLSFLQDESARILMLERYNQETIPVKVEIINSIGVLGNLSDNDWLLKQMSSSQLEIRNSARIAINQLQSRI